MDGWEPVETHEHHYDKSGRLTRTTVTRETEWDDTERAWMLALRLYRQRLGPCGHYLPHTTATEDAYHVPPPTRCDACTATSAAMDAYRDSPHPGALLFHAERR